MGGLVILRIYRTLMRVAHRLDVKEPYLKTFIVSEPSKVYDPRVHKWRSLSSTKNDVNLTNERLVEESRRFCGQGLYYLPHDSVITLKSMIKQLFKSKMDISKVRQNILKNLKDRINLAYTALRYLNKCINIGDKLVTKNALSTRIKDEVLFIPSKTGHIELGCLLIAHPLLIQSSLTQSIIMIVKVSPDGAILGLVLNRPMDYEDLGAMYYPQGYCPEIIKPFADCSIYHGGDVEQESYYSFLHTCHELAPCSVQICPGLYFSDNIASAYVYVNTQPNLNVAQSFKFFRGCARWGLDQLEGEVDANYWISSQRSIGLSSIDIALSNSLTPTSSTLISPLADEPSQPSKSKVVGYNAWKHVILSLPSEFHPIAQVVDVFGTNDQLTQEQYHALDEISSLGPRR